MERKIGDTFEHEGKKLIVEENKSDNCVGCFFNGQCPLIVRKTAGECQAESRVDDKYVIFVEVKEQSQKETEAVEERKIGEVFDYNGKKLRVEEFRSDCVSCFFDGQCSKTIKETTKRKRKTIAGFLCCRNVKQRCRIGDLVSTT